MAEWAVEPFAAGFDVDGVLGDLLTPWFEHMNELHGTAFTPADMRGWEMTDLIGAEHKASFYESVAKLRIHDVLLPYPGAIDAVMEAHRRAEVFAVTSHMQKAETWVHDRDKWLERLFKIDGKHVCHTHAKHRFELDLLIDDNADNIERWAARWTKGRAILWDHPHNRAHSLRAPNAIRASRWEEVLAEIPLPSDHMVRSASER